MLNKLLDESISILTELKDEAELSGDPEVIKRAKNYLEWITLKTEIVRNEKAFIIPEDKKDKIKRSSVAWVHFGYNISHEFGGKHPALILRVTGDSVFVLPLDSGKIPESKKDNPSCVTIPFIQDFTNMPRWANVLRIVCVSIQRIDFDSDIGRLQGKYLDKVNEAIAIVGVANPTNIKEDIDKGNTKEYNSLR